MGQPDELSQIIAGGRVSTLFQPIVDPRLRSTMGFEALSRGPSDSRLHSPLGLFAAARDSGRTAELEECCLERAAERFQAAGMDGRLFLNLSPTTLFSSRGLAGRLAKRFQRLGLPTSRCVLEITEQSLFEDYAVIRKATDALRDIGCEIAVDDLGAGYSGLKTWSELRPDYVKIDRYFVSSIHSDGVKAEILRSIVEMSRAIGSRVIAEGVETAQECAELLDIGVDYLQGYFFGRPLAQPEVNLTALTQLSEQKTATVVLCAEQLAVEVPSIDPAVKVQEVAETFRHQLDWDSLAVVKDGRPLGLVRRDDLFLFLSKPLHPEVYNRKPITSMMESPPLLIDARLRLEQVSRLVTRRARARVNDDFIITRDGRYLGLGKVLEVLRQITAQQIQNAKDSNPLTLLPGNLRINEQVSRLLSQGRRFVVCYFDLDHFKPYNDQYGYARGDQFLLHAAQLIRNAVCNRLDFLGHLGGDDFIAVMRSPDWEARILGLIEDFNASIPSLYTEEHRLAGGIRAVDRDGVLRTFPLSTISIAALEAAPGVFKNADALADELRRIKALAKNHKGTCLLHFKDETPRMLYPR